MILIVIKPMKIIKEELINSKIINNNPLKMIHNMDNDLTNSLGLLYLATANEYSRL